MLAHLGDCKEKSVHIRSMLKSTEPRHSWEELGSEEEENTVELIEDPPQAPPLVEKGNILDMTCR